MQGGGILGAVKVDRTRRPKRSRYLVPFALDLHGCLPT
jgi:hypothetical protein